MIAFFGFVSTLQRVFEGGGCWCTIVFGGVWVYLNDVNIQNCTRTPMVATMMVNSKRK